jgi:ribosomal protein S18 acetylase RimI-like enzyme
MSRPDLQLVFEINPSPEVRLALSRKIDEFNDRTVPFNQERFAILLRDTGNSLAGGISGILYWGWLYIDDLWVDESLRRQGFGTELMKRAEAYALTQRCYAAWVDTFQARRFYERLGYEVFASLDSYPGEQCRWFLKKRLG